ncbi:MAG: NADPH-dependent F420 reductase [Chloroflexota bacterium]|nr:NADPH-dependent F420 reductase [Chloroflexota bacterium]
MTEEKQTYTIGIIGGTGKEGKGLAYRWVQAGHRVIIGSRKVEKAQNAVAELLELFEGEPPLLEGMANEDAVEACEIAVLTVPYSAHRVTLEGLKESLQGKILVDVVVPIVPPKVTKVQMPAAGSAAQEAQAILGDDCRVVDAFQNISHERLMKGGEVDCDVLVCGKTKTARRVVLGLVADAGLKGWDAGPIENAVVVEGMTSVLIGLNIQHKVHASGIRITGIPDRD